MEGDGQIEDSGPLYLLDRPQPWLLVTPDEAPEHQTFYNLSEGILRPKNIPELHNKYIGDGGGWNGWLYLKDRDSTECSLLNIATMEKVSLPPLVGENSRVSLGNCFVTLDPNCRPIVYDAIACNSCTMLGGKIYGLLKGEQELVVCDTREEPYRFEKVGINLPERVKYMRRAGPCIVVECGGEILLVAKRATFSGLSLPERVYRADFSKKKWVEVTNIGKHAIFLQTEHWGYSCSTEGLEGVEGNSIYYTLDRSGLIQVFHMENQGITLIRPFPHLHHRNVKLTWVMLPPKPKDATSQIET